MEDLTKISLEELQKYLASAGEDLERCVVALDMGVTSYFDGERRIADRVLGNYRLIERIQKELTRRGV